MTFPYLQSLLQTDKFSDHPELASYFEHYEKRLTIRNMENFFSFLGIRKIPLERKDRLTYNLNKQLLDIENQFQQTIGVKDLDTDHEIDKLYKHAEAYLNCFEGYFIKTDIAQKLIDNHPLEKTHESIGPKTYKETNPLILLALGRYAEQDQWNKQFLNDLSLLHNNDFEHRQVGLGVVNHNVHGKASQQLIEKKCFNSHDKVAGLHLISTLPDDFERTGKSPVLRTLTKMIHYHKEMELFSAAFKQIASDEKQDFGEMLSKMLTRHELNTQAPLFNTFEIIEGLANREITRCLSKMAVDCPDLEHWIRVHNIAHIIDNEFISLSLWRLTAWYLNGKLEHTIKMYKDEVLADMLIEMYDEKTVENAVIDALAAGEDDVLNLCRRSKIESQRSGTM